MTKFKVGTIICGLLAEGNMAEGDRVKFGPNFRGEYCTATIESIHRNKQPVLRIVAGDSASIVLRGPSNDYLNATLRRVSFPSAKILPKNGSSGKKLAKRDKDAETENEMRGPFELGFILARGSAGRPMN